MSHSEATDRPSRLRRLGVVALIAVMCGAVVVVARVWFAPPPPPISGRVIAQDGSPIEGAEVRVGGQRTVTDADGEFQVDIDGRNEWVRVTHPDYLERVRAAQVGAPVLVRLTPDPERTVSLHFTGDVMFGRRFYDPNEDGDTSDGLLQPGAGADEHAELLEPIEPLLAAADLTVVNLESPLIDEPWFDPNGPRPARFHPTKEFVFASEPAAAKALFDSGVDVVDLGNNHMYDALEAGVTSTIAALDEAGVLHYGAGRNSDEAWQPAVVEVKGTSIAFMGCTSIVGDEHEIDYVAGPDKGGAAMCDEDEIRTRVGAAAAEYDTVVFSVHGGYEYGRAPSPRVRALSAAATESGARIVVDHHPHVTGGFEWNDAAGTLTAFTMGNFVFDQTVWPTFGSYLLDVDLRDGAVVRAYAEPLMIERYVPRGLTAERGDHTIREAAGREPGPFVIEDGAMEVDVGGRIEERRTSISLRGESAVGTVHRLAEGTWISDIDQGTIEFGRDLLTYGTFENDSVDPDRRTGSFWDLTGEDKRSGPESAYRGVGGAQLDRDERRTYDAVLSPLHRVLVDPSSTITVQGMVRTEGSASVDVQLSWYNDTKGPSSSQTIETIVSEPDSEWTSFRIDVEVPDTVVAVGLFVRLAPPPRGVAHAFVDDIAIIEWAPLGTEPSQLFDHLRVTGEATATLAQDHLPGAADWAELDGPTPMPDGEIRQPDVVRPPPTTTITAGDETEPGDPGMTSGS